MNFIITLLNIAAGLAAMLSAFCWIRSSRVAVKHPHAKQDGIFHDGSVSLDGMDFFSTARLQGTWNKLAAVAAGLAAFFQGAAAGLSALV
jgi:hypothetical protein